MGIKNVTTESNLGFGWDPMATIDVQPLKETGSESVVPPKNPSTQDEKLIYLQMQQAIVNKDAKGLKQLRATLPLSTGQHRVLGLLALENFSAPVIDVLRDLSWHNFVTKDVVVGLAKKGKNEAFVFAVDILSQQIVTNEGYERDLFRVFRDMLAPLPSHAEKFDVLRSSVWSHLTEEEKQKSTHVLWGSLRNSSEKNVNLLQKSCALLSQQNWQPVFTSKDCFKHLSTKGAWSVFWFIKQFPSVGTQFSELMFRREKMEKQLTQLITNHILNSSIPDPSGVEYKERDVFTTEFLLSARKHEVNLHPYLVRTQEMRLSPLDTFEAHLKRNPSHCEAILQSLYEKVYKTPLELPLHMFASPFEQLMRFQPQVSCMDLLRSENGRNALNKYCANPMRLRELSTALSKSHWSPSEQQALIARCAKYTEVLQDKDGATWVHNIALLFPGMHSSTREKWLLDTRLDWERTNHKGVSARDVLLSLNPHNAEFHAAIEKVLVQRDDLKLRQALKREVGGSKKTPTQPSRKI